MNKLIKLPVDGFYLKGELVLPPKSENLVIFSHGSGSCRMSKRNRKIARYLQKAGFGTLLFDLLNKEEDEEEYRFDIDLLAHRLMAVTRWIYNHKHYGALRLAYFGQSLGTAAALKSAAQLGSDIKTVVSRGGRADLIKDELPKVVCPTLFIVGEFDSQILKLNELAIRYIQAPKDLLVIPDASHFFEEPGKLDTVARIAINWFQKYLSADDIRTRLHPG